MPRKIKSTPEPEWAGTAVITAMFGISRAYIYELINAGEIRSRRIGRGGIKRASGGDGGRRRLISVQSVRDFIERLPA